MVNKLAATRDKVSLAEYELRVSNVIEDEVQRHVKRFHHRDVLVIINNFEQFG